MDNDIDCVQNYPINISDELITKLIHEIFNVDNGCSITEVNALLGNVELFKRFLYRGIEEVNNLMFPNDNTNPNIRDKQELIDAGFVFVGYVKNCQGIIGFVEQTPFNSDLTYITGHLVKSEDTIWAKLNPSVKEIKDKENEKQ